MATPTNFTFARRGAIMAAALVALSMRLYPGGTVRDASTSGYSFWQNFLSDLGQTIAWDGQPNGPSAWLFLAGFGILALALAGCALGFVRLHATSPGERAIARAAGAVGLLSCIGLIGAALIPADRFLTLHLRFSGLALAAAPVASLLFAAAAMRDNRVPRGVARAWLALTLVPAMLVGVGRWGTGIGTDDGLRIQVTAQKIAAVAVVIICVYLSHQADRVAARASRAADASPV